MEATLTMKYNPTTNQFTAHIVESDGHEYVHKRILSEHEACSVSCHFALFQAAYHPLMSRAREGSDQ